MSKEIDVEAFKFITKLSVREFPKRDDKTESKAETKLKGFGKVIDLGEVMNFGIECRIRNMLTHHSDLC